MLEVNSAGEIVPSRYALDIKGLGFDIITWTFERSDLRRGAATDGFYYLFDAQGKAIQKDSDMYKVGRSGAPSRYSGHLFRLACKRHLLC